MGSRDTQPRVLPCGEDTGALRRAEGAAPSEGRLCLPCRPEGRATWTRALGERGVDPEFEWSEDCSSRRSQQQLAGGLLRAEPHSGAWVRLRGRRFQPAPRRCRLQSGCCALGSAASVGSLLAPPPPRLCQLLWGGVSRVCSWVPGPGADRVLVRLLGRARPPPPPPPFACLTFCDCKRKNTCISYFCFSDTEICRVK